MEIKEGKLIKIKEDDIHNGGVTIPPEVTIIGEGSIAELPMLNKLVIPENIKVIERAAICNTGIEELIIPEQIEEAGFGLLRENRELKRVVIRNPDLDIQGNWFDGCNKLTSIKIGVIDFRVLFFDEKCYEVVAFSTIDECNVFEIRPFKRGEKRTFFLATKDKIAVVHSNIAKVIELCKEIAAAPNIIEKYKDINLESLLSKIEYEIITENYEEDIDMWLRENNLSWEGEKTVRELLKIMKGHRNYREFAQFIADRYRDRAEGDNDGGNDGKNE